MIRGKSFEYSVSDRLSQILRDKYIISNPTMNPQTGIHDIDVKILNTINNKSYRIECKLAAKGSFKINHSTAYAKVKCMRSRTLGNRAAEQLASIIGVPKDILLIHNDQYRPEDFDIVVTTLGNSLYSTDNEGYFYWNPPTNYLDFLEKMGIKNQQDGFDKMYAAKSKDLASNEQNGITCSRRTCKNKNCNFIPNYPMIYFSKETGNPISPWVLIDNIESILM